MRYIGGFRGAGVLTRGDERIARANYDFDAYQTRPGEITGSGEIRTNRKTLKDIFGLSGLSIITDDGRKLTLRFTEKQLRPDSISAHVEVVGELKASKPAEDVAAAGHRPRSHRRRVTVARVRSRAQLSRRRCES